MRTPHVRDPLWKWASCGKYRHYRFLWKTLHYVCVIQRARSTRMSTLLNGTSGNRRRFNVARTRKEHYQKDSKGTKQIIKKPDKFVRKKFLVYIVINTSSKHTRSKYLFVLLILFVLRSWIVTKTPEPVDSHIIGASPRRFIQMVVSVELFVQRYERLNISFAREKPMYELNTKSHRIMLHL